jgi:hypothetical protein
MELGRGDDDTFVVADHAKTTTAEGGATPEARRRLSAAPWQEAFAILNLR